MHKFIKRNTCMKGNWEEVKKSGRAIRLWCTSDPEWRRGKDVCMEVAVKTFDSRTCLSQSCLWKHSSVSQEQDCIHFPTSLNYWWESAHGRHCLGANAGKNFIVQQLESLVSYAPCSSRKQDIFSCVPHFGLGWWKGFNWQKKWSIFQGGVWKSFNSSI